VPADPAPRGKLKIQPHAAPAVIDEDEEADPAEAFEDDLDEDELTDEDDEYADDEADDDSDL
jgi:hypothetical protein